MIELKRSQEIALINRALQSIINEVHPPRTYKKKSKKSTKSNGKKKKWSASQRKNFMKTIARKNAKPKDKE